MVSKYAKRYLGAVLNCTEWRSLVEVRTGTVVSANLKTRRSSNQCRCGDSELKLAPFTIWQRGLTR